MKLINKENKDKIKFHLSTFSTLPLSDQIVNPVILKEVLHKLEERRHLD